MGSSDEKKYYSLYASVINIKERLWYESCGDCKKKVVKEEGEDQYFCKNCSTSNPSFVPRLMAQM